MVSEVSELLQLKIRLFANTIKSIMGEPLFKSFTVALFVCLWIFGIFYLAHRGLSFIIGFPGIGDYLVGKLFYLFSFAIFTMLIISNTLLAYSRLYIGRENLLLFSLPIPSSAIVSSKLWETIFLGSWAFALMGMPLLMAYFVCSGLGIGLFFLSWLYFIPLLIVCGSVGLIVSLLLALYTPRFKKWMGWLLIPILASGVTVITWRYRIGHFASGDQSIYFVNQIVSRCRFASWFLLPSRWVVDGIFSLGEGRYWNAAFLWLLLLSNAVFLYCTCALMGEKFLLEGWNRRMSRGSPESGAKSLLLTRAHAAFWSILFKDLITFFRDPTQWGQFALFFGLLGIYILNLRNLPYDLGSLFWVYLLFILNISALGLTLAALSSRFFFPLMSLELKRFWFLGLTPFGLRRMIKEKYLLCAGITVGITLVLALLSGLMLGISRLLLLSSLVSVVFMGLAISGLSIGIGAVYPNLKASSSAEVISGLGGTMILVLSLIYVCLALFIQAIPLYLHLKGLITESLLPIYLIGSVCVLGGLSISTAIICLSAGRRKLEAMDL